MSKPSDISPLPWTADMDGSGHFRDADEGYVGNCHLDEDAVFIATACNSHADLLGVLGHLQHIASLWDAYQADDDSLSPHDYIKAADVEAARKAIAKVNGGPS